MLKIGPHQTLRLSTTALLTLALVSLAGGCNLGKPKPSDAVSTPVAKSTSGASGGTAEAAKPKPMTAQEQQIDAYAKLGYRLEWISYATVMSGAQVKLAESLGDVVAIQDTSSALSVINSGDGALRWAHFTGDSASIYMGLVRVGNAIIACDQIELQLFDVNSGELLEKQRLARLVTSPPAQLGDVLVFGTGVGLIISHQVNEARSPWSYMINGPVFRAPAVMGNDTVGVVSKTGQVLILEARYGSLVGSAQMFGGTTTSPVADDDGMFVAGSDQSLYAFNRIGGQIRWRIRTEQPLTGQPNYYKGTVLVQMPDGFQGIDAQTGKVRWTNKDVNGAVAAIRRNRAIVWNGQRATTVDLTSGQTVDSVTLPGTAIILPERGADGPIYLITPGGQVSKLTPR